MASVGRLPPLPTLGDIVRLYNLRAKKHLSQNFLLDMNINRKFVKQAGKLKNHFVIEVGPGPGGITRAILEKNIHSLTVVEKDHRFVPGLKILGEASEKNLRILQGDILDYDLQPVIPEEFSKNWEESPPDIHILGNLPFNVATPLILKWLKAISERSGPWKFGRIPLTLSFQKEVAERMVSPILTKERCRLSIMCQHLCKVKLDFIIPGRAFMPQPDVDVGVVSFTPLIKPEIQQPFKLVEKLSRHIFHHRQKKVSFGASTLFPLNQQIFATELLERAGISEESRSYELTMEDFNKLCCVYADICDRQPGVFHYDYRNQTNSKKIRMKNRLQTEQFEKQILYGDERDTVKDYNI